MDKIEKLFDVTTYTETRKVLNRSHKTVDTETLNQIENGITIEQLETIKLPIYKYKTQITIHGLFPDLERNYLNGYKLLFQNQNKSIGVKYNAIDSTKKKLITKALRYIDNNWYAKTNSSDFLVHQTISMHKIKTQEDLQEIITTNKKLIADLKPLFYGYANIYISKSFLGNYLCTDLYINAIPETNLWRLIETLTGIANENELETIIQEHQEKEKQRQIESDIKFKQEQKEKQELFEKKRDEFLLNNPNFKQIKQFANGRYIYFELNYDRELNVCIKHIFEKGNKLVSYTEHIPDLKAIPETNKRKKGFNINLDKFKESIERGKYYKIAHA